MPDGGQRQTQTISQSQTTRLDPASQGFVNQMRDIASQGARGVIDAPGTLFPGLTPEQLYAMQQFQTPVNLGLGGFNPMQVTAPGGIGSILDSPIARQLMAGAGGGGGGQVSADRINAFMNPYTSAVVDAVRGDFELQRQAALTRAAQEATGAGAYGGSRSGLLQAQALNDVNRAETAEIAGLRSAGYTQALNAALQEWQTNAQVGAQAGIAGNQALLGLLGLEQERALQGGAWNLQAQLANQRAGLDVFGQQSQNAIAQANLQSQQTRDLFNMGDIARGVQTQQAQEDLFRRQQALQLMNLGLGPTGSITNMSGRSEQFTPGAPWWQTALGAGLTGAGLFFGGPAGAAAGAAVGGGLGVRPALAHPSMQQPLPFIRQPAGSIYG